MNPSDLDSIPILRTMPEAPFDSIAMALPSWHSIAGTVLSDHPRINIETTTNNEGSKE
jgi:hypothetical protein